MIIYIIDFITLFIICGFLGWIIELIYKRYFNKMKKWVNPGFLSGPYLPIYGLSAAFLYFFGLLNIDLIYKILFCSSISIVFELLTGLFFEKNYKVKLWDYSDNFLNYRGIICFKFSIYWILLSTIFFIFLFPVLSYIVDIININIEYSVFIGFCFGIIIVDVINSLDLVKRIKRALANQNVVKPVNFDQFKVSLKDQISKLSINNIPKFLSPFKGHNEISNFHEFLRNVGNKYKNKD